LKPQSQIYIWFWWSNSIHTNTHHGDTCMYHHVYRKFNIETVSEVGFCWCCIPLLFSQLTSALLMFIADVPYMSHL